MFCIISIIIRTIFNNVILKFQNLDKFITVWNGSSTDITFTLPDNLTFEDIKILNVVGARSFSLLQGQFENSIIGYDNGVYSDGVMYFEKKSETSGRIYASQIGNDQIFSGFKSIVIMY